jgi:serine/threonine-protein kinase HipA
MKGTVYFNKIKAGVIEQTDEGYRFTYDKKYLKRKMPKAISLTLPLQEEPYESKILFSFFDGLIPEGWLLDVALETWKLNPNDRMKLLLTVCEDCIGAVSVIEDES